MELVDQVGRLSKGSLIHHSHPDAPKDWYYLRHKRWLVFYRVDEVGLYVMRVVEAARDLPSLLRALIRNHPLGDTRTRRPSTLTRPLESSVSASG